MKLGVAAKLVPPLVAPISSDSATSAVLGLKFVASRPALMTISLNVFSGMRVNLDI